MGIRQKFLVSVLLGVSAIIVPFGLSLMEQRDAVISAYEARSRSVVSMAISLLQQVEQRRLNGELDLVAAQEAAKETVSHLRYDDGEYLFVIDRQGKVAVDSARPELIGSDMRTFHDVSGNNLAELIDNVLKGGDGIARYTMARLTGGAPLTKISYVATFAPWGWLVGSGIYLEDAEAAFRRSAWRVAGFVLPIGALLIGAIVWLARSVTVPLLDLSQTVYAIQERRYRSEIRHTGRADELGQLARAVASLQRMEAVEDELRQSRELIVKVFDTSQEAALITDGAARVVLVSAAMCRISGYSEAQLIGQKASVLRSGHHDESFFSDLWQALRRDGVWEGEVWNRRANGEIFVVHQRISAIRDEAGRIINFVAMMQDVVEHSRQRKGPHYLPRHDPLTNLADGALLRERFERAMGPALFEGRPLALLVVDVDAFAAVNQHVGMVAGDEILRYVALRLMKAVRTNDTVARLGGDDYAVLMEDYRSEDEILRMVESIREAMRLPFMIDGQQLSLSVSIGVARMVLDGRSYDTLLAAARAAVAKAKAMGGNGLAGVSEITEAALSV